MSSSSTPCPKRPPFLFSSRVARTPRSCVSLELRERFCSLGILFSLRSVIYLSTTGLNLVPLMSALTKESNTDSVSFCSDICITTVPSSRISITFNFPGGRTNCCGRLSSLSTSIDQCGNIPLSSSVV